jgi:putative tricarboxylic transport membrane protein
MMEKRILDPRSMGSVRLGRLIIGVLGVGFFGAYLSMALEMPASAIGNPGPGLWPTMVGITGIGMSIILALEALFLADSASGDIEFPRGKVLAKVAGLLGLSLVYIATVPIVGQLIGSFIFFTLIIKLLGNVRIIKAILLAAVSSGLIFFFFTSVLGLRLPMGVFGIGG